MSIASSCGLPTALGIYSIDDALDAYATLSHVLHMAHTFFTQFILCLFFVFILITFHFRLLHENNNFHPLDKLCRIQGTADFLHRFGSKLSVV